MYYIKTIVEKGGGGELLLKSNFSSYPQYFFLLLNFYVRIGTRISLRDKRLFEVTEVEIARVNSDSCALVTSEQIISTQKGDFDRGPHFYIIYFTYSLKTFFS